MSYQVENVEPGRLILKNFKDKSYITLAVHETDTEGLAFIAGHSVGDPVFIKLGKPKKAKPDEEKPDEEKPDEEKPDEETE